MKKIILSVLLASGLVFSSGLPTFAEGSNYNFYATCDSMITSHPTREQFKDILSNIDYDRACLTEALIMAGIGAPNDEYDFEHVCIVTQCYRSWMKKKYNISFNDNRQVVDFLRSFGDDLVVRSNAGICVLRYSALKELIKSLSDLLLAVVDYEKEFNNIEEVAQPIDEIGLSIFESINVDEDTNDYSDEDTYDYSDSENIL